MSRNFGRPERFRCHIASVCITSGEPPEADRGDYEWRNQSVTRLRHRALAMASPAFSLFASLLLGLIAVVPITVAVVTIPTTAVGATQPPRHHRPAVPLRIKRTATPHVPTGLRAAIARVIGAHSPRFEQLGVQYGLSSVELKGSGFTLTVGLPSVGRGTRLPALTARVERSSGDATYGAGGISESFAPKSAGIEQAFTIADRPPASGPLVIDVPVHGLRARTSTGCPGRATLPSTSVEHFGRTRGAQAPVAFRSGQTRDGNSQGPGTAITCRGRNSIVLTGANGQARATYSGLRVTDATGRR
jgi:hypothetical protein